MRQAHSMFKHVVYFVCGAISLGVFLSGIVCLWLLMIRYYLWVVFTILAFSLLAYMIGYRIVTDKFGWFK